MTKRLHLLHSSCGFRNVLRSLVAFPPPGFSSKTNTRQRRFRCTLLRFFRFSDSVTQETAGVVVVDRSRAGVWFLRQTELQYAGILHRRVPFSLLLPSAFNFIFISLWFLPTRLRFVGPAAELTAPGPVFFFFCSCVCVFFLFCFDPVVVGFYLSGVGKKRKFCEQRRCQAFIPRELQY